MATTLQRRDHLLRLLNNATPGTTEATDYVTRAIQAGNIDYLGRPLSAAAWIAATVYAAGAVVTEVLTGKVLQATVGGTSHATTEPVAPGYGATVVDNTVTWLQITA